MTPPTKATDSIPSRPPNVPRRGSRGTLLVLVVVLGGMGMFVGMQMGSSVRRAGAEGLGLAWWENLILLGTCLSSLLLVLLVHELGHLTGGLLVGFRAFLLIVGPIRLERASRGWRVALNTNMALFGGLAGSAPTDGRHLARRTAVMVAGGPMVSLLVGIGAAVALVALDLLPLDRDTPFSSVLSVFGLLCVGGTSAAIGVVTLMPLTTSGFLSDGARLLRLICGGPVATSDAAIQAIVGASLSGVRPRDWDPQLLQAACALVDGSVFEFTAWQLAQMHAADAGKTEESLYQLRQLLPHIDRMPASLTAAIHLDAARQFAIAGAVAEARAQFALATGPTIAAPYLRPFAEAALLASDGRRADAMAIVPTIRAHLEQSIDRGAAQWLTDSLISVERTPSMQDAS